MPTHAQQSKCDSSPSGGVVAIRGFVYQFDATLLHVLQNPTQTIQIEDPYDMHGDGWCTEVKYRSNPFAPSVIAGGISALWNHHRQHYATNALRLYCYFPDKSAGTKQTFSSRMIRKHWGTHLTADGHSPSERELKGFAERLQVCFAPDLATQFDDVVELLRIACGHRTREEAIATHAILRAHLLDLLSDASASRALTLSDLRRVNQEHRACVLDSGYRSHLAAKAYVQLIRAKWLCLNLNVPDVDRAFVVDLGDPAAAPDIAYTALLLVNRFARLRSTKGSPPRAPLLCVRGLCESDATDFVNRLYDGLAKSIPRDRLATLLPLVDGYPCLGAGFRPDLLKLDRERPSVRLRLVPPQHIEEPEVLDLIRQADVVYHIYLEGSAWNPIPIAHVRRFGVENVEQLQLILK